MKQTLVDLRDLPEADGFKLLIVCIDYFSKWLHFTFFTCLHECVKMPK